MRRLPVAFLTSGVSIYRSLNDNRVLRLNKSTCQILVIITRMTHRGIELTTLLLWVRTLNDYTKAPPTFIYNTIREKL